MARNFIHPGETNTHIAPAAVAAGSGMLIGVMFAVALSDAAQGAPVEGRRVGIWDLAKKAGEAWVQDTTKLYWDNTNKVVTSTATGNTLIGVARQNQAAADTVGRVLLTGQLS